MGGSAKIRHRRRRREGLALVQCVRAMERALSDSLGAFARERKDSHVTLTPVDSPSLSTQKSRGALGSEVAGGPEFVNPCEPLPGIGRRR